MFRSIIRFTYRIMRNLILIGLAMLILPRLYTSMLSAEQTYDLEDASSTEVAIVFGAGLLRDGTPSAVLRHRVLTAVDLYQNGKVDFLLMSGQYPEPDAMKEYAIELGMEADDIWIDDGGLRTYDTCYRAKEVFGLQDVSLVTQAYHLPRAIYLCESFGLEVQGVNAFQGQYWRGAMFFWQIRESFATLVAFWDVNISEPTPEFSDLIEIKGMGVQQTLPK